MWAPKPAKLAGSWGVGGVEGWVGRLEAAAEDSAFKHSTLISERRVRFRAPRLFWLSDEFRIQASRMRIYFGRK